MKSAGRVAVIVLSAVVAIAAVFMARMAVMSGRIEAAHEEITHIDPAALPDGAYRGTFEDFLVAVELEVVIGDRRIETIEIVRQNCGPGYEAHETVDRIIEAQSPLVEVVSGASGSSKAIMAAAYRALRVR